jgi:hypothetical protein
MRLWVFASLALIWVGCGGSADPEPSPLHKLCMDACAHVHAKNCYEAPAINVADCDAQCSTVPTLSGSPCTDEYAVSYACTAKATISCAGNTGETPVVIGCEAEEQAASQCQSPGLGCARSFGSEDQCVPFGFKEFYVCSDGITPGPNCVQVTSNGFCCP